MPSIAQTIKENFVASHTFRFITPTLTDQAGVPNPCTSCHKDKNTAWASKQLQTWITVSPWRMAQRLELRYSVQRLKTSEPLVPPKPKEFDRA